MTISAQGTEVTAELNPGRVTNMKHSEANPEGWELRFLL